MSEEKDIKAMTKAELKERLEALGKALEQDFPTSGTNDELRERIVTAEEMLELEKGEVGGGDNPDPTPGESGSGSDGGSDESEKLDSAASVYVIKARSKTGFFRCGKFWPHEGREIKANLLSDDEIKRLKADKNLVVALVTAPALPALPPSVAVV